MIEPRPVVVVGEAQQFDAQLGAEPGDFGNVEEPFGGQEAVLGVVPTSQALEALPETAAEWHDRLIVQRELTFGDRRT